MTITEDMRRVLKELTDETKAMFGKEQGCSEAAASIQYAVRRMEKVLDNQKSDEEGYDQGYADGWVERSEMPEEKSALPPDTVAMSMESYLYILKKESEGGYNKCQNKWEEALNNLVEDLIERQNIYQVDSPARNAFNSALISVSKFMGPKKEVGSEGVSEDQQSMEVPLSLDVTRSEQSNIPLGESNTQEAVSNDLPHEKGNLEWVDDLLEEMDELVKTHTKLSDEGAEYGDQPTYHYQNGVQTGLRVAMRMIRSEMPQNAPQEPQSTPMVSVKGDELQALREEIRGLRESVNKLDDKKPITPPEDKLSALYKTLDHWIGAAQKNREHCSSDINKRIYLSRLNALEDVRGLLQDRLGRPEQK